MDDRRSLSRLPITLAVKISHPDIGEKIVHTRDLSEHGLFVVLDPAGLPAEGEIVLGQVQDDQEDLPVVKMRIVRIEDDGCGLQYIEEEP